MQVQTYVKNGRNLRDGTTPHQCSSNSNNNSSSANNYNPNKKYHEQNRQEQEEVSSTQTVTVDNGPQIAALIEQVKELRETLNILISQIQMLRSEVKNKK
jgi:cellobiose-specific phosphotransferase system component IIB